MFWLLILIGIFAGVLINLVADSLPTARRLRAPACAACGKRRTVIAWSGLAAYLGGHRQCPHCGTALSARHMAVELVAPALLVLCWARTGMTITTLFNAVYSAVFVLIAVTDIEHRLILHVVSLPAILVAVVGAYTNPTFDSPKRALLGGGIGLVATLILYSFGMLFSWFVGRARGEPLPGPAFGFGDVTLGTFLGLILGAPEIIFALVLGILSGFLGAVVYLAVRALSRQKHQVFSTFMPYGPFLILGGAAMLYFGREFMAWYLGG